MLRSSTLFGALLLIGASASAQSIPHAPANAHTLLRPVTSAIKSAGVYHIGLGTWTRRVDASNATFVDTIYANTCPTGYFAGQLTNEYFADEGRVPGPSGPVFCDTGLMSTNKGCDCSYTITGFQIGYCSGLPGFSPVHLNVGFQSAYTPCAVPNPLPGAPSSFDLTGLPGAGVSAQGCWVVDIDLAAASQTFSLNADGASCTWPGTGVHTFGWTFQNLTSVTGVGSSYVGPLIAGNGGNVAVVPNPPCSMVDGTRWDTLTCAGQGGGTLKWPNNLTEDGYGLDTQDRFRDDSTNGPVSSPGGPGCFFFGTNPVASFHLRLFSPVNCNPCGTGPGFEVCRPGIDFLSPACPCNSGSGTNQPTTAGAGCNALTNPGPTQTGGALMTHLPPCGTVSLSGTMPGIDTLQISVTGLPTSANESAFLLQGTVLQAPVTFGQGLRCVGGSLKRIQIHSPAPGNSTWPAPGDFAPTIQARSAQLGDPLSVGAVRHYFIQYRQTLFEPGCAFPSNFNASNAHSITWSP